MPTHRTWSIGVLQRGHLVLTELDIQCAEGILEMAIFVASTIGAVKPGRPSSHASATRGRLIPRASATRRMISSASGKS